MNLLDFEDAVWLEPRLKLKKFLLFGNARMIAVIVFGLAIYAILLLVVTSNREYMPPASMILLQTFLFCFVSVSSTHAAIAGEREKRTWDTLLVAPVTNQEIVIGKALVGLGGCGFVFLLLLIPTLVCQFGNREAPSWGMTILHEAVSLTFAFLLVGLGIYVSSRTKRAFSAQLVLYTTLFVGLIVSPIILTMLIGAGAEPRWLTDINPFVAIARSGFDRSINLEPPFHVPFLYLIGAFILLLTATTRLTNEDGGYRLKGNL